MRAVNDLLAHKLSPRVSYLGSSSDLMDHDPAIGLVLRLPGRIGAVARIGLLVGPSDKQADAHAVK